MNVFLNFFNKDPLIKRNIVKTISWRLLGSVDTVLLGWLVSGNFAIGAKIGSIELITKMIIYYVHERLWQKSHFGLPTKHEQAVAVRKENIPNLFKANSKITRHDRELRNLSKSFTLWMTGLSGSGKSTLSEGIEDWLYGLGYQVFVLDGDNTRLGINSDLSFSDDDRSENIRRVAELCRLFNEAGVIVVASFISPFIKDRLLARNIIGESSFTEIYVDASIAECQKRDTKGLYEKAKTGKIKNFTGISSSYEPPLNPNLIINTEQKSVDACLLTIKDYISPKMKVGR